MRKIILIVEDSESCAETLKIALEMIQDTDVQVALSGREALTMLAASPHRIAAIVTDLQMPSMTGLDLLAILKKDPALADVPTILISGNTDPALRDRALHGGAALFFPKPYSPLEVRRKLEAMIR